MAERSVERAPSQFKFLRSIFLGQVAMASRCDGHALVIFRDVDKDFPRWLVLDVRRYYSQLIGSVPVAPEARR